MYSKIKWLQLAHQLQSIAQAGLTYSENKYDIERFEQLLQISKEIVVDHSEISSEKIDKIFDMEEGYLTPKVDVRGVIFREEKLLMVKETLDGKWALPGGWADVGYTPSQVVEKEVQEEAGLIVKATDLMAVMDKKCHPHPADLYYVYKMFFLCKEQGGKLQQGMETSDVGFFGINEIPELSTGRNTTSQIKKIFELKDKSFQTLFD